MKVRVTQHLASWAINGGRLTCPFEEWKRDHKAPLEAPLLEFMA